MLARWVRYRPLSVTGSLADGGVVLAVQNGSRRHLIDDQADRSPRPLVSPRILADMNPSCVQLLETRARSADAYRGPSRCVTPVIVELPPVQVVEQLVVATVQTLRSTPEPTNLPGVSSHGAWEGRLRPRRRRDLSRSSRGCRRRRTSSSSSSGRRNDHRSSLSMLLRDGLDHDQEGRCGGSYRTLSKTRRVSRGEESRRRVCDFVSDTPDHLDVSRWSESRQLSCNLSAKRPASRQQVADKLTSFP